MTQPVKNEYYTSTVLDYTHQGLGVVKIDNYPIFVHDVLKDEKIEFKVIKANKKFGYGKMTKVIEPADERIVPPCEYYYQCGGCQIQPLSYNEQQAFKKGTVEADINRQAKLGVDVHDTIGMESPDYYRNKSQIPVQKVNGELKLGLYRPRSHDIIDIKHCMIQKNIHNGIMNEVRELLKTFNISIYDERRHKGLLRHLIIRSNHDDSEVQVGFITNGHKNPFADIIKILVEKFPTITSAVQNINMDKTNVIYGSETKVLHGSEYITDELLGKKFNIRARSFYQVNHGQTEKLYKEALKIADLKGDETIIDTYCGIGTIGQVAADHVKKIIGIEVVDSAVEDARENAKLNGIDNAEYYLGKSEVVMKQLVADGVKPDLVFVDPPRKGCHEDFLNSLIEVSPEKIVYISCNPGTLQRDLKILHEQGGYSVSPVTPVDLFPQTNHVEAVTMLTKQG
ncbi:MAG TPA: 23S rRNA (uracil(1939)-C(5))-methyltransferase RlmD [Candidatus Salinicoccus merdavium]|nr:23S rRNA (uracil(1939)-C(5))-methyltransferase RlmD [Candidatus Salinicoccus merdavium]